MSSPVTSLVSEQDLKQKLAGATTKLVVLEFVKSDSQICEYVKRERDEIAKEMEDKAEFYELDIDTFKKFAEKFKVEALPAFVVMQNFVKKRHVVGTADLKKDIDDAYAKFERNAQVDSSPNNGSEQRQAEENSQQELERHWPYRSQQEKAARSSGGRPIGPARARVKNALLDNLLRFLEKRYRR